MHPDKVSAQTDPRGHNSTTCLMFKRLCCYWHSFCWLLAFFPPGPELSRATSLRLRRFGGEGFALPLPNPHPPEVYEELRPSNSPKRHMHMAYAYGICIRHMHMPYAYAICICHMVVESRLWNPGYGIMAVESWLWNPCCVLSWALLGSLVALGGSGGWKLLGKQKS